MKKLMTLVLCFCGILSLSGCGYDNAKSGDYTATIMVNGTLYYSTDKIVAIKVDENDIQYTTSYAKDGVPKEDGETNFNRDTGNPYVVLDDMVAVLIDNEWIAFKRK